MNFMKKYEMIKGLQAWPSSQPRDFSTKGLLSPTKRAEKVDEIENTLGKTKLL